MMTIFDAETGTRLRALIRAATLAITAFGFKLSGEQVAAIQGLLESALAIVVASPLGDAE